MAGDAGEDQKIFFATFCFHDDDDEEDDDGGGDDGGVGGGDDDNQYNILAASAFLATTVPDLRTQEGDEAQQLAADSWQ